MQLKSKLNNIFDSPVFRGTTLLFAIWAIGSISVWSFENETFSSFQDALWWTIVTITTVGYGDISPSSPAGRIIAVGLMFSGIGIVAALTGSISSIITTKKIMEGKGLEKLNIKNHIIICGWNGIIEKILNSISIISSEDKRQVNIVLINNLSEEKIQGIITKHEKLKIQFVRGEQVTEPILNKANVKEAQSAIVISEDADVNSDDKTILTTLTIKNISPSLKVIAYVNQSDKISYLKRANVDEVILANNYETFMAVTHVMEPGVPQAVNQLLDIESPKRFKSETIPQSMVGKTFKELSDYYKTNTQSLCIGLFTESHNVGFADFLSSDSDALDAFIEKKLRAAGKSLNEENKVNLNLNPKNDYIIKESEGAILIP